MTPERQNAAIAMALGKFNGTAWCLHSPGIMRGYPDYTRDLNAMHEAEKTLMDGQLVGYVDQLLCLIHEVDSGYFHTVGWDNASDLITATAAQRAEAFLRTIGKWEEDK